MENEQELDLGFDYEKVLKLVIEKALEQEKCPYECEVNLTFTDNEGIRNINRDSHYAEQSGNHTFPATDTTGYTNLNRH